MDVGMSLAIEVLINMIKICNSWKVLWELINVETAF